MLGTLNGVGTSVAAFGRAAGPAVMGSAFSFGVQRGYVIFAWWLLAVFGAISAVPVYWTVETDGLRGDDEVESGVEGEDQDEDEDFEVRGNDGGYGAVPEHR